MAFDNTIVAIAWREGQYSVIGAETFNTILEVDWGGLRKAYPVSDVNDDVGYQDLVQTVSPGQIEPYIKGEKARAFIERTKQAGVFVYLLHKAEWESGMN